MKLFSCQEASWFVSSGELAGASFGTRLRVKLHLLICSICRRYKSQIDLVNASIRKIWAPSLSKDQIEALQRRIIDRLGK